MVRISTIIKATLALFLLITTSSFASEIILKSGQKLEGKIIEQTDKYVKFDSGIGVAVTYYADEIDTVDGKKIQIINSSPKLVSQSSIASEENTNVPSEKMTSNSIFIGNKQIEIVDNFAVLLKKNSDSPELHIYFFSHPLTQEYKNNVLEQLNQNSDFLQVNDDMFEVNLILKQGSQSCGIDAISASGVSVKDGTLSYGSWSLGMGPDVLGINKFNCSDLNSAVDVALKNNIGQYHNFFNAPIKPDNREISITWDINLTVPILVFNGEQSQDVQDETGKPPVKDIKPILKDFLQGPDRTDCSGSPSEVSNLVVYKIGDFQQNIGGWPVYAVYDEKCSGTFPTIIHHSDKSGQSFNALVRQTNGSYECFIPEILKQAQSQMNNELQKAINKF